MKRVLGLGAALALMLGVFASPVWAAQTIQQVMGTANYQEVKGNVYSWAGFPAPCNIPTSALILLEKQGPADVLVGDVFTYFIQVSNRSEQDMISVTLDDVLPEGFTVQKIEPEPTRTGDKGKLQWDLGAIPAKTAKRITITGRADKVGYLASSSLARICYELPLPLAVRVLQCNVDVQQRLPAIADLCDPIELVLTAFNLGSAPATNVVITDQLPEGLTTEDGQSLIKIPVGVIPVGEQRSFRTVLKASRTGDFDNLAVIAGDRNCTGSSTASIRVVSADLRLTAGAPADGYICTPIPYSIQVTNKGNGPARDVIVAHGLGGDFKVTNVSEGGKVGGGRVVWNLGDMMPGETRLVGLEGASKVEGQVFSDFSVSGRCLKTKRAKHVIDLKGVAGVLTSVQDNCDPVRVGGEVTYTITATNTGSRNDHDVQYAVVLDEGMEFVGGTGATEVSKPAGGSVAFAPLPVLAAGQTAAWQVTVRITTPGDKRLTTTLTTRQVTNPVVKSESTTVYQPNMKMVIAK